MSGLLWEMRDARLEGGRQPRLDGVSVSLFEGSTAVVGYSGAGKTSLLNVLVGFERPHAGSVRSHLPTEERLPLFWVPENFGLWPHLSVAEHLQAVIPADRRTVEVGAEPGVEELLEAFDLAAVRDRRADRLSLGEESRLSVARGIASGARVLVMDEPLAHVDPARVGRYWERVRDSCRRTRTSLVFATHSPECVLSHADRVVCLQDGRVAFEGRVEDLYYRPATPELASLLGPANWIPPEESRIWLTGETNGACYRPEQIALVPAAEGSLVVEFSRFAGSVAEAEVRHEQSGRSRRFFHRPARTQLRAGDRVVVKILLAMACFCLLLSGCEDASGPVLDVGEIGYWQVPVDGRSLPAPRSMTVAPNGEVYVLDNAGRILVYSKQGKLARQWRMPESDIGHPESVCLLLDGRVAIADTHYHRVVYFDQQGKLLGTMGSYGKGEGQFIYPVGITRDDKGFFYVCEYGSNDRVQKFKADDGSFVLQFGSYGVEAGAFQRPSGLFWHDGRVYVADAINNRVQIYSDAGKFVGILGANDKPVDLQYPYDVAEGIHDDLYVIEYGAGRLTRLSFDGEVLGRFGHTGRSEGEFSTPWGLAVTADGRIIIADTGNRRIVELRM